MSRQLLTESEERIAAWRQALNAALGNNGQLIIDVIPQMELILGPQPPYEPLESRAARARFDLVFQNFTRVFAQPDHPLVLFLDDLQWVDGASLELLQTLLTPSQIDYLFVIGAYRDNEVSDAHPLMIALNQMNRVGVAIHEIALQPLSLPDVNQLIADALGRSPRETEALAELTLDKTQGNPFFLSEFLKSLHADGLLAFDLESGSWQWDLANIQSADITDNVVELMTGRVQRLDDETQQVMKLASCIGSNFDLRTLAIVHDQPVRRTVSHLQSAAAEGLVLPIDDTYKLMEVDFEGMGEINVEYKFAHDRIQQAAFSLIHEHERPAVHWKVGQLLLAGMSQEQREQRVFDIVNQLDLGLQYVADQAEADEIATLSLSAARKAKAAAAYATAFRHSSIGIQLLTWRTDEDPWTRRYDLSFQLHREAADAACLNGEYGQMQELLDVMLQRCESTLDKIQGYKIEIQSYAAREKLLDGVSAGLKALRLLGIDLPQKPTQEDIGRGIANAAAAWADMEIEEIADLPRLTDEHKLAALELLASLYIPAFNGAPELFMLIVFEELTLTIAHGLTYLSSRALVAYGFILCALGQIDAGYRFGKLALALADEFEEKGPRSSTLFMFYFFVLQWKDSIWHSLDNFIGGYRLGLEAGDIEFAALNLCGVSLQSFWCGRELGELVEDAEIHSAAIGNLKQELSQQVHDQYYQIALNLMGRTEDRTILTSSVFDEQEKEQRYKDLNSITQLAIFNINKMILSYLFGQYAQAAKRSREAKQYIYALGGMTPLAGYYFYDSLIQLAITADSTADERAGAVARVKTNQEKIALWAGHAPMNFRHKHCLVAAELARVRGEDSAARDLYDKAIQLASSSKFVNEEALANELASAFYRARDLPHVARHYLQDAHYAYQRWGARAKVEELEERFSELRDRSRSTPRESNLRNTSTTTERTHATGALDLASVLKASQAISGEIVLERLVTRLLSTVIENAGAEKAFLIVEKDGELVIEAEGAVGRDEARALQSIPVARSRELSPAIVNLVGRTRRAEVLNDAVRVGIFADDPYVLRQQPKSILCMPLVNQGQLTAILYLENNLITGAFTREHLEVLNYLSAQMAISLHNARLMGDLEAANSDLESANRELESYSHTLEARVTERTQALANKNRELGRTLDQLKTTQNQLIMQEKMASLGTLTAGIAHEMRNPLNFVKNFAELSIGLSNELKEELGRQSERLDSGAVEYINEILGNLEHNAAVIKDQGERANGIVGSMLLHSRTASDERMPTDLNGLLEEAIELAYRSMRAKEASFAITIDKSYDDTIGLVEILPQELSRVFINLIDNACYATNEKAKARPDGYSPRLAVATKRLESGVKITISDNGIGIPDDLREKVFTPFFTTKPAGSGTGLGLSLSYDIIAQKHGGEIRLEANTEYNTEFAIMLPMRP